MKSKIIGSFLTVALSVGFALPAYAVSTNPTGGENQVDITNPDNYAKDADSYLLPKSISQFKVGSEYKIGKPAPGGKAIGVVPDGLAEFYAQKIAWGKCDDFGYEGFKYRKFECGYAIVPLDYVNPAGETIAISMMRLPATDQANKIGSLFMNPGGPGGSGLEMLANRYGSLADLGKRFDLVSFDPRGVGASLPLVQCESNAYFDALRQGSDALTATQKNKVLEAKTNECYKNSGKIVGIDGHKFIDNIGTHSVIRDLDIMRSVVGDEKLTYYGVSYGTSIGYQYLQYFTGNVRAMLNDGVVNPFENAPETYAEFSEYTKDLPNAVGGKFDQTISFNKSFERFAADCAKNHGYASPGQAKIPCALGEGDLASQTAEFQNIARKAYGTRAYVAPDGRVLSFGDIIKATLAGLRSESSWNSFNEALHNLKNKSDAKLMMSFADRGFSRNPRTNGYTRLLPTFYAVRCADNGTEPGYNEDPAKIIADLKEGYKLAPFSDPGNNPDGSVRGLEPEFDRCTYFKAQHTMDKGKKIYDAPKVLFLTSRFDAPTPYQNAVIAAAATGGAVLSVPGAEHGNFEKGFKCANKIGEEYLINLTLSPGDSGNPVTDKAAGQDIECQVKFFDAPKQTAPKTIDPIVQSTSNAEDKVVALPVLALNKTQFVVGEEITAIASGLKPGTTAVFTAHSTPLEVGAVKVDADGVAKITFNLPAQFETGDHRLIVSVDGVELADAGFTLVNALPNTGNEYPAGLLVASILLLLVGGLIVSGRRISVK